MTPEKLWKFATSLEEIAKNMKGLALLARNKHERVENASLHVSGNLFPVTFKSLHDDMQGISHAFADVK